MRFGTYPIGHLGLRVSDLARARRFYIDTLAFGLVREAPGAVFMDARGVPIALIGPAEQAGAADRFDPFRVGLDHLALAVADAGELEGLREQLGPRAKEADARGDFDWQRAGYLKRADLLKLIHGTRMEPHLRTLRPAFR